jgi:hypothetical protein
VLLLAELSSVLTAAAVYYLPHKSYLLYGDRSLLTSFGTASEDLERRE